MVVRTRFAPSPTGYLHVGNARTALFSWLLARHTGGEFLLRIEDTDLKRSTEEACRQLLTDLRWLGLDWDNVDLVYQSRRVETYNRIIDRMIQSGQAYKAYETPEELDLQRKSAQTSGKQYRYHRVQLTDNQIRQYESEGRPSVVRFVMPVKDYSFYDAALGKDIHLGAGEVQDFVIRKSDGMPTYHFAVVVDDAEMQITHVLRDFGHLLNTMLHISLQEALGYPRPIYAHLTTILNTDGSKMGKRDRDKTLRKHVNLKIGGGLHTADDLAALSGMDGERVRTWLGDKNSQLDGTEQAKLIAAIGLDPAALPEIMVRDFRVNGYLPEALLNFLALLGWSPGGNREHMTIPELIEHFSLDGLSKTNPKFNRDKLRAFNPDIIAIATPARLIAAMRDYLAVNTASKLSTVTDVELERLIDMNRNCRTLREIELKSAFLFERDQDIAYDPKDINVHLLDKDGQGLRVLRDLHARFADVTHWEAEMLNDSAKKYAQDHGLGLGDVAHPLRIAVTGTSISPPIFRSIEFLGKTRTLGRLEYCMRAAERV